MRRILVFNRISADGSFAQADGDMRWMTQDDEVDKAVMSGPSTVDTFLFGRRTYELMASFWPTATEDAGAEAPHGGGALSDEQRKMADGLNRMTKLVFSRMLEQATWKGARIVRELDPRVIAEMKQGPGQDMLILGSGSIVSQLTQHRLIDEYQLLVCPLVLGSGQPLFRDVAATVPLRLLEARAFTSGNVMLRYALAE